MNRQEKQKIIESLKSDFADSQALFVIGMQGMTVTALQELKKGIYSKGGKVKVAKNTLLKRATQDMAGVNELEPYFKEQIAIVFTQEQAPDIAKILFSIAKENEKLIIKAGSLNKKLINRSAIEVLATLPPREILLAQALGTLQAPITAYVNILHQLMARLVWVLNQIAQKRQ